MSKTTSRPSNTHSFDRVANVNIPRSKFDLSHGYKTTFDGGFLIPVMVADALVGDSWKCDISALCRMTTPIVPFMDNLRLSFFSFAVPKRLLWDNFEDFWTGSHKGKVGTIHTEYPTVTVTPQVWDSSPIFDYMGIPRPVEGGSHVVNALPLRAYNLIYNEWFRDENLINEIEIKLGDSDTGNTYELRKRGKRKDYFTSALPFVQKGPDVELPLGSFAPVVSTGVRPTFADLQGNEYGLEFLRDADRSGQASLSVAKTLSTNTPVQALFGSTTGLTADLTSATAATINSLREAFAVQSLLEKDARHGSRMVESILGHYGVTCPDFRLQRPEFIGGGKIDFNVNTVAQTSATQSGVNTPQGNLSAFVKAVGQGGFQYSAVEPTYIITLACVTCDLTYQSGIDRLWSKRTRMDEYWPEFANLGEQPVYEKEIFATGKTENDDAIFGYQERFSEYRYFPSLITGKMRSTAQGSLDAWHLAQVFDNAPSLSKDFIEENPPFKRVLAVQDEPEFILDLWFNCKAIRPLPLFSTPATLSHL